MFAQFFFHGYVLCIWAESNSVNFDLVIETSMKPLLEVEFWPSTYCPHGFWMLSESVGHYVPIKSGYILNAEELVKYTNARVAFTGKLLGGVVFVDNLHKDPGRRFFINSEEHDVDAQAVDQDFLSSQPKVDF